MRQIIKSLETANNTYTIGYQQISKTSYEERIAQRKERLYMLGQKCFGSLIILISLLAAINSPYAELRGFLLIVMFPIGLTLVLTKDHAINI